MRRMSHYLGFYTEILSTKVGIKRSGLIELITIVQVYDHLPTGESTRSSPDKVRLEVVNIAGMYSQARPGQARSVFTSSLTVSGSSWLVAKYLVLLSPG